MTVTSGTLGSSASPWAPTGAESSAAGAFAAINPATTGGQVYFGTAPSQGGGRGASHELEPNAHPGADQWMSAAQAKASIGSWTQKQMNDLISAGIVGGLLKAGDGQIEATNMWNKLVDQAALFGSAGQKVTPFDVLSTYVTNSNSAGVWKKSSDGMFETNSLTGEKRYIGPKFRTTTASTVSLTDPTTAHAIATSVFQQLLGRDPLPGEMNSYASALQQAEQANPTQVSTTTQYDDSGNPVAVSKQDQKGGYTDQARNFLAAQQVKGKSEYGATQAATTYENAFTNAVFGSTT